MSKAEELKLDIDDLNNLLQQACRQKAKDVLSIEVRRLQTELAKLVESTHNVENKPTVPSLSSSPKCYEVKLSNYGWCQTDTFMQLYVTLSDVHTLPKEAVSCNFTERSLELRALNLNNRNYELSIRNLCEEIDPTKSYIKVNTDKIAVFLAKKTPKQWSHVTGIEKRIKEGKTAPLSDLVKEQDPDTNVMNLMKKMYQDGDDEMKKVIAKVWTEGQEKKTSNLPNFPPL